MVTRWALDSAGEPSGSVSVSSRPMRQPRPSSCARRMTSQVGGRTRAAPAGRGCRPRRARRGWPRRWRSPRRHPVARLDEHAHEATGVAAGRERLHILHAPEPSLDPNSGLHERGHDVDVPLLGEVDRGHVGLSPGADGGSASVDVGLDPRAGRKRRSERR